MKEIEWKKTDEITRQFLSWIALVGWIFPIWIEEYRWRLFFSWFGFFVIGGVYASYKKKYEKQEEEK